MRNFSVLSKKRIKILQVDCTRWRNANIPRAVCGAFYSVHWASSKAIFALILIVAASCVRGEGLEIHGFIIYRAALTAPRSSRRSIPPLLSNYISRYMYANIIADICEDFPNKRYIEWRISNVMIMFSISLFDDEMYVNYNATVYFLTAGSR